MFTDLISNNPLLSLGLYILFCILAGIGLFVGFHTIKRNIQIRKNMKARARNDKSN